MLPSSRRRERSMRQRNSDAEIEKFDLTLADMPKSAAFRAA
jgi:hypothetical protein